MEIKRKLEYQSSYQTAYLWVLYFFHPTSLHLLADAFDPYPFKIIIDIYDSNIIFFIALGLVFVGISLLYFSAWRSYFSICCNADLVVLSSLKFCLCVNGNQKKAGVPVIISDKIDFKTKTVIQDKEGHHIIINFQSKKNI